MGIAGLRDGYRFPEWAMSPWGGLNDGGQNGDKTAGDGIFTTAGVRLYKATGKDPALGPITLRCFVWDK